MKSSRLPQPGDSYYNKGREAPPLHASRPSFPTVKNRIEFVCVENPDLHFCEYEEFDYRGQKWGYLAQCRNKPTVFLYGRAFCTRHILEIMVDCGYLPDPEVEITDSVIIAVEKRVRRRTGQPLQFVPFLPPLDEDRSRRKCEECRKKFDSTHNANRRCVECRRQKHREEMDNVRKVAEGWCRQDNRIGYDKCD